MYERLCLAAMLLSAAMTASGCSQNAAADRVQAKAHRAKLLLEQEPEGAMAVLDVRESLTGEQDVVIVGRIGGVSDPWTHGKASFVMMDAVAMAMGDDHSGCDDPGCPYCSSGKESDTETLAYVNFVDDDGKVLPVDARELFELEDKQTVVVQGRARINEVGYLVVTADGLYVRR